METNELLSYSSELILDRGYTPPYSNDQIWIQHNYSLLTKEPGSVKKEDTCPEIYCTLLRVNLFQAGVKVEIYQDNDLNTTAKKKKVVGSCDQAKVWPWTQYSVDLSLCTDQPVWAAIASKTKGKNV